MSEFEIITVIHQPVERVFGALENVRKAPDWTPGLVEVRTSSDEGLVVGSTITYVGSFLGRHYESAAECTEYIPKHRLTVKSTTGPFHLEVDALVEELEDGVKVTANYRGESRGSFKLGEPVIVHLARKQFEAASENL
jgi:carbon monoxide dehydrogenase subunit G